MIINYPRFNYDEFVAEIQMSDSYFILVEGRSDGNFIEKICEPFWSIVVATAEDLINDPPLTHAGNRQKVEYVSQIITVESFYNRFVGFVDREFRGFEISNRI